MRLHLTVSTPKHSSCRTASRTTVRLTPVAQPVPVRSAACLPGEVQTYISIAKRNVKQFARAVRGHWGIENTCHWSLDMTFREDESRARDRRLAENLGWLRRFRSG